MPQTFPSCIRRSAPMNTGRCASKRWILSFSTDRTSSYVQDLQIAIESAVRAARSRPRDTGMHAPVNGTIQVLRADLLNAGVREQLISVARVILVASRGDLANQLTRLAP